MEKIWGVYNTYNAESLKNLENALEADVYKKIDNLGGEIFWAQHDSKYPWGLDLADPVIFNKLVEAQYNLEYLVYYTRKFGVEFSREPSASEHVEKSESFKAWFSYWDDHFKKMDPEVIEKFIETRMNGGDITPFLPTGSWKDRLEKPVQKELK